MRRCGANLDTLAGRGVRFVDPGDGYLACGWVGRGRLAEPETIVAAADGILRGGGAWAGRSILVTAGPTYEDLDPVRYLGNRSTGRMGYAVAAEAAARGARVLLVSGPTALAPPAGVELTAVRSACEMHVAVVRLALDEEVDAVVMAAAVADYTPAAGAQAAKIRKTDDDLVLALRRTPDVLADLGARRGDAPGPVLVGFAAETGDAVERAPCEARPQAGRPRRRQRRHRAGGRVRGGDERGDAGERRGRRAGFQAFEAGSGPGHPRSDRSAARGPERDDVILEGSR